jgi:hypothetical protein
MLHEEVTQGSKRLYAAGIYHCGRVHCDFGSLDRTISLSAPDSTQFIHIFMAVSFAYLNSNSLCLDQSNRSTN